MRKRILPAELQAALLSDTLSAVQTFVAIYGRNSANTVCGVMERANTVPIESLRWWEHVDLIYAIKSYRVIRPHVTLADSKQFIEAAFDQFKSCETIEEEPENVH